ncbi:four helix bundle protein [Parabacteroides sp. OttesenSCG-928-J18]|nr:four helix bundle protein [Parabacteroides sp. OttesenSCG-928-J18]
MEDGNNNKKKRKDSVLNQKSFSFAVRIVNLAKFLQSEKQEYIQSKQILRSGTSIGALICESEFAQSNQDFVNKLSISLKEANETDYWLRLLNATDYIDDRSHQSLSQDCDELIAMLIASIKTTKNNINLNSNKKKS